MGDALKFRGDMIVKPELAICRLPLLYSNYLKMNLKDNNFITPK
jgi:hypothetical protein